MSKYSYLLILTILFSLLVGDGFSQQKQNRWFYLSTSADGWKFFYQKEIQELKNGNLAFWQKVVYLDDSSLEMFQEWECSQNRYRQLQVTAFSPTGKTLNGDKNLDWTYVSSDSISSLNFSIVCEQAVETKLVEITALQANLRSAPGKDAPTLQAVKRGSRFTLSLAKPVSGWYNVVNEKTQQDYWIHGNTVKIIEK